MCFFTKGGYVLIVVFLFHKRIVKWSLAFYWSYHLEIGKCHNMWDKHNQLGGVSMHWLKVVWCMKEERKHWNAMSVHSEKKFLFSRKIFLIPPNFWTRNKFSWYKKISTCIKKILLGLCKILLDSRKFYSVQIFFWI